jgi:recombination protein RecA
MNFLTNKKEKMSEKKTTKNIAAAMAALEKRYGEKVVMKMTDAAADVDTFSSGRPDLDEALGGGYGVGKIVEVFAESGCGKTGLALEAIKVIQDLGGVAAIIDSEHALNTEYCELLGIDVEDLYICQPSFGEQAIETIRALIGTGDVDLIVVDSVAAMVPKAELEGEAGEAKIALQARMMSQGMKLITAAASSAGCTVMFINQLRSTIAMYGPSKNVTGGNALKFYATQRLEVKNKGQIRMGEDVVGFKQYVQVVKNKLATPFKAIDNNIIYGVGVDRLAGLLEVLIEKEILLKKGGWYSYKGEKIANGIKKLRAFLDENPDVVEDMENDLKNVGEDE